MLAFITPTILDINMILFMGVSIKENENPIGFFGTGLKYAIAVLLRTGHEIEIHVDGIRYTFHPKKITLRNTEQDAIIMRDHSIGGRGDIILPFTLNYGRTWEVWMAYRELVTNTMDEKGFIQTSEKPPGPGHTIILIAGDPILKEHRNHDHYFLKPALVGAISPHINIHHHKGAGAIFYRGVNVCTNMNDAPSRFSYEVSRELALTEDRTLKNQYSLFQEIGMKVVTQCSDESVIRHMIAFRPIDTFESDLDYDWSDATPTFCKVVAEMIETDRISVLPSALRAYEKATADRGIRIEPFSPIQQLSLDRALSLLRRCGYKNIERYPILRQVNSSHGHLGLADRKEMKIYLTDKAFAMGVKTLMGTILEEFYHLYDGVDDCTREFQDLLLTKIIDVYEEHVLKEAI